MTSKNDADLSRYRGADGIVRFVREILHADPAPYQVDILRSFVTHKRIAIRGPHGIGKTTLSAWVILWAVSVHDCDVKVVTTAGAWRQLQKYTWPEVHKWATKADWRKLGLEVRKGKELLDLSITIGDRTAFAVASNQPALIEGAHATKIFYIFDEAKAIENGTWDAAEGAFAGTGEAYALAISTPGETSGRFYDIHARKPGFEDWHVRHVTLEEYIAAGRQNREWVEQRKKQWGEKSAVFQNRVLGEFADSGEDSVIPLRWVELANERWLKAEGKGEGRRAHGCDPAYKGEDKTSHAAIVGSVCETVDSYAKEDTMQTAGRIAARIDKQTPIAIDVIGIGAGVYDRLAEQGYMAMPVNVSHSTDLKDSTSKAGFKNLRSALWWILRESLDPDRSDPLALPPDDEITGDLTAPRYHYLSNGNIEVESKPDIKERIGRSPDKGDSICLALYAKLFSGSPIEFVANGTGQDNNLYRNLSDEDREKLDPAAILMAQQERQQDSGETDDFFSRW